MPETLTFATVASVVLPFLVAAIGKTSWSSQRKRVLQLIVSAIVVVVYVALVFRPELWTLIVPLLAAVVGGSQLVYTILKPTGALDWLEQLGSPERAEQG